MIRLPLILIGITFLLLSLPLHAETTTFVVTQAKIFRTKGAVEVVDAEGDRRTIVEPKTPGGTAGTPPSSAVGPVTYPSVVRPAERIVTAVDSECDIYLAGAGSLRVAANSEVLLPAEGKAQEHSIEILKGRAYFSVKLTPPPAPKTIVGDGTAPPKPEFRIKAPKLIVGVGGTRLFMETGEKHDVAGVHEGVITVTEPEAGKSVVLKKGFAAYARPGELSPARKLTPVQLEEASLYNDFDVETEVIPYPKLIFTTYVPDPGSPQNWKYNEEPEPARVPLAGYETEGIQATFGGDPASGRDHATLAWRSRLQRLTTRPPIAIHFSYRGDNLRETNLKGWEYIRENQEQGRYDSRRWTLPAPPDAKRWTPVLLRWDASLPKPASKASSVGFWIYPLDSNAPCTFEVTPLTIVYPAKSK